MNIKLFTVCGVVAVQLLLQISCSTVHNVQLFWCVFVILT